MLEKQRHAVKCNCIAVVVFLDEGVLAVENIHMSYRCHECTNY